MKQRKKVYFQVYNADPEEVEPGPYRQEIEIGIAVDLDLELTREIGWVVSAEGYDIRGRGGTNVAALLDWLRQRLGERSL